MGIFLHWSFLSGAHPDILCHPELSPLLLRRVMVVMRTKSGFTALTEKFIQRSGPDRGTDELAQTLNDYLCDILEEMLIFGGDIFKFAGDAVLVLWRAPPRELAKTISLVLQCSRQIQRKYGNRDTRVGQKVRLKIGISAGPMDLLLVGDRRRQYFLICGQALDEVREAEELANAGEVILSATSWELCEQHRLRTRRPAGKRAVKVTGMDRMSWSECQDALRKLVQHPRSRRLEGEGAMRPALPLPSGPNTHDMLSKYISEAALRKLDDRVPLELFSELRPVTSLFVQLQLTAGINTVAIHTAVHDASRMMLEILCPHKGEINKIVLFDKGCVFLCVFGLGGEKLPYESIHALQSASQIFNSCSMMLMETEAVSVAVTSGTVFCGVTGHPLRHEYTVIGQKVNLAARMMVHYPGLVSCDAVTYASSRLPPYYFKELPERKMKGLSHPGTVYQYVGITKKSIFGMGLAKKRSEYAPLLGREKEIDLFGSCLKAYEDLGQRHILAFEGRWAPERATYLPNWPISARLLATVSGQFPVSDKVREMRGIERKKELHSTWAKVLEKTIGGEFGIFVIDNAHFIDPASWSIMSPLLRNVSYFMVMSLAPGYARTEGFCKAAADNTTSQKITYLRLDELKPSAVVQTVCQNLRVDSTDLARFLIQRSSGIPYYCKELLGCLLCNDMLLLRTRRRAEKAEDNWESLIIEASPLAATSSSSAGNDGRVCIIRPDVNPENTVLPTTLKEIALAQLDRIKPLKQTVLKFAAVIGPVFTTQLLSHILPDGMRHKMNCLLDMLVSDNILKWLKTTEVPEDVRDPTKGPGTSRQAGSGVERPSPSKKTTERQSGVLVFCVPLLREAAYELWPERQRVALHRKCAAFLERHVHKCKSCGQGDFVAFHRFTVTRTWEGGSSQGPAEQGDPHSWEALVLAGEQLTIC
ncbi:adenylate cyclase type 10-like [Harpia harpyja]|uniref:adenylate cyclase type 10-like n=1 Tax=Harpia harpyja TaxID=202280 RepID=UPI0022B14D6D|nr:adenylate cyclase type 10-like [Harpia harpyja]